MNDFINNMPPSSPLKLAGLPTIDVSGGWWDAGDYMKYVETASYAVALMEVGIRDFPDQMGASAPVDPPRPPARSRMQARVGWERQPRPILPPRHSSESIG